MDGSCPIIRATSFQKAFFAAQIVIQPKERRDVIRSRIGRSVRATGLGWVVDGLGIVFFGPLQVYRFDVAHVDDDLAKLALASLVVNVPKRRQISWFDDSSSS